jgi:hypothetical protein
MDDLSTTFDETEDDVEGVCRLVEILQDEFRRTKGYSTVDGRTLYQFWLNSVRRYEHWIPNANFKRKRQDEDYSHHMLTVETQMRLYDNKPWYYNNKMLEFLLKKP